MHRRRLLVLVCLVLAAGPARLSAQSTPRSWSLGGTAGVGRTWDDESSIGRGFDVGGYAAYRWRETTALEASIDLLTHNRSGGAFEARGHTTFLGGSVVQYLGRGPTRGYVTGGVVLGIHAGRAGFPADHLFTDTGGTRRGFTFGGGLSHRAGRLDVGPLVGVSLMTAGTGSTPTTAIVGAFRIGISR